MRRLLPLLIASSAACSFSGAGGAGTTDGQTAEIDAAKQVDAAPIDAAPPPCVPGFLDLCKATPRTDMLVVTTGTTEINTGMDPRCVVLAQVNGPEICLLYFTKVDIQAGATVLAYGARALALASTTTIDLAGTLDVSSKRTRLTKTGPASGACMFATAPENDDGGGGGGAGGTLATQGGPGGDGDKNMNRGGDGKGIKGTPGAVVTALTVLRGGCSGQTGGNGTGNAPGGVGGPAGGGVYLMAKGAMQITGAILAGGAGGGGAGATGIRAAGGGGGSGGVIVLQASSLAMQGTLLATGGGGGEGGDNATGGAEGKDAETVAAAAGGMAVVAGGDGGPGAVNATGGPGVESDGGGGAGGGGAGFIRILSPSASVTGMTAPTAVVVP